MNPGEHRRILITGAGGSIGRYLVERFSEDGDEVLGLDVRLDGLPATVWDGPSPHFARCDVTDPGALDQVLTEASAAGLFDVVINNAGYIFNSPVLAFRDGRLQAHDLGAWNEVIAATLNSAFVVSARTARAMVENRRPGVIINIGSICAVGNVGQAAYSAAKAGVNALTMTLAKELGAFGVRVAGLAPGFFDTASTRAAVSEDALNKLRKSIPLKRLGELRHLYHALRFIVENDYFHGKVLELDGGLTL
ncbi:MAG: SDR family NAD(P)-dependent oxidoreductase [Gammaproteobacteria bacterium]|nr:SDR family NAD(P)-dependent oxidoreductase [Gammaproteobacteria bacterium]